MLPKIWFVGTISSIIVRFSLFFFCVICQGKIYHWMLEKVLSELYFSLIASICQYFYLRPPGGGSITVFRTLFNKAVLLLYAFTLDPYNPMVLWLTTGSRFQAIYSFTIEILTGSTIIKNYCHFLRYTWFTPPGTLKSLRSDFLKNLIHLNIQLARENAFLAQM